MTSITNRIDVRAAKKIFDELRLNHKIKLSKDLTNSIDTIIENNMNITTEEYADELSNIRWVEKSHRIMIEILLRDFQ